MSSLIISAVIATRNRPASLARLLDSLARQERRPDEVIVVDASEQVADAAALEDAHAPLDIVVIPHAPSVCAQRNLGIGRARGSHVLLCDDDVELPADYVAALAGYLEGHADIGAVSGGIDDAVAPGGAFRTPSLRSVVFAFAFQRSIWGDLDAVRTSGMTAPLLAVLRRWYRRRGNTWTLAGWPLVTQVRGPAFRTAIFGMMAAVVRRSWLLSAPYDERLGPHGIGDHYGVALQFPDPPAITVLPHLVARHHRDPHNRLTARTTYYRRILALHYFLRTLPQARRGRTPCLVWSLLGNALAFATGRQWDLVGATGRAAWLIVSGRSPLLRS
jgi:glycosyltransferase involved in cell wall biosynthesis